MYCISYSGPVSACFSATLRRVYEGIVEWSSANCIVLESMVLVICATSSLYDSSPIPSTWMPHHNSSFYFLISQWLCCVLIYFVVKNQVFTNNRNKICFVLRKQSVCQLQDLQKITKQRIQSHKQHKTI